MTQPATLEQRDRVLAELKARILDDFPHLDQVAGALDDDFRAELTVTAQATGTAYQYSVVLVIPESCQDSPTGYAGCIVTVYPVGKPEQWKGNDLADGALSPKTVDAIYADMVEFITGTGRWSAGHPCCVEHHQQYS